MGSEFVMMLVRVLGTGAVEQPAPFVTSADLPVLERGSYQAEQYPALSSTCGAATSEGLYDNIDVTLAE